MFPARAAPVLFALILSGLMSCLVSGFSTLRVMGLGEGVLATWMTNWLGAWTLAFPGVLIVAPVTRRLVARLVRPA